MSTEWAALVGQTIEPESWSECAEILLARGGDSAMYRGQRCFDWDLTTTLERALDQHAERWNRHHLDVMHSMSRDPDTEKWVAAVERDLTESFRKNAHRFDVPGLPEAWDVLGWWELMQHHGAPTRLMDWTHSPFIAIWFALDQHVEGDMVLWVYDQANAVLNHLQALSSTQDDEWLDLRQRENKRMMAVLNDGNPALWPVTPRQFARSVAQQSVLAVSTSIGVGRPAYTWIWQRLATRIRLREAWKAEMAAACQSLGFSRPGLYRDLDSLGAFISQCFNDNLPLPDIL